MADRRIAKAAVYHHNDDCPWLVTETPSEVEQLVREALRTRQRFVHLTLGNDSEWNAKPLRLKADIIVAISPPKSQDREEDQEEGML